MFHDFKLINNFYITLNIKFMTIKESLENLLNNLVNQTLSKRIIWQYNSTMAHTIIDAVQFSFYIDWKMTINGLESKTGFLRIKGIDIDYAIFESQYPELIIKLDLFFRKEFFNKNKPSEKKYIDKIENLNKKISLEEYRDMKISSILDDKK